MSFRELHINPCYESGKGDMVEDFYVPVLSRAVAYDRIAGFFSSTSLAVAARGMEGFIKNGGKMRLLCSPNLNHEDISILERTSGLDGTRISLDLDNIESEFVRNHVKALGWMLQNGLLEIRLVTMVGADGRTLDGERVEKSGLFHQKVGILTDGSGDSLSFSGSINETAAAWVENGEEFKVFKSWDAGEYFEEDRRRFDEMWLGKRRNLRLYDVPEALREDLIRYSRDFDRESISLRRYVRARAEVFRFSDSSIPLFGYQAAALDKWKGNGCRMLFEMATGTGKTRTAVAGMSWLFSSHKSLVAIIACPQDTLARQWKEKEVGPLGVHADVEIVADSTNAKWETELRSALIRNAAGKLNHCIIYTTHKTCSGGRFISCINEDGGRSTFLFVGDEAHWLGAGKLRAGLLDKYSYRIGLSATPSRWFDDAGTGILQDYFGNCSFEFSIRDALTEFNPITRKHFLVNYRYDIRTVALNDAETSEYKRVTTQLVRLSTVRDKDAATQARYERCLERRADIIRNAEGKYAVFDDMVRNAVAAGSLANTIVFVSPRQIERVSEILWEHRVSFHRLTETEGTKPEPGYGGVSEREHIINEFKRGGYQVLLAIKCLDEGIDIPIADRGILLASSTNPREYVQRIGRIIRQAPGKTMAHLYDVCVSRISCLDGNEERMEEELRKKEMVRLREISENAINAGEALKVILTLNK